MPMTIDQFLKLSLETEMPEFKRLKINVIDLAETAGLYELKKEIEAANNFEEITPHFDKISNKLGDHYGSYAIF